MNVRIAEQFGGIARRHTAAVEDRQRRAAHCRHDLVDQRHDASDLVYCRRGAVLADGPNRLVRDDHLAGIAGASSERACCTCARTKSSAPPASRTADGSPTQISGMRPWAIAAATFQAIVSVGFPEMLPAIRVANFDQGCAGVLRHPHGDLASPGALGGPVSVLGAEQHWRVDGQTILNPGQSRVRAAARRVGCHVGTGKVTNSSTKLSASASVLFIFQLVPIHSLRVSGNVMDDSIAASQELADYGISETLIDSLPLATMSRPFWKSASGSWWVQIRSIGSRPDSIIRMAAGQQCGPR